MTAVVRWLVVILALMASAGVAHAEPIDPAVESWADWIGIDATELAGAVNTTGLHPEDYLVMVGHVGRPASARWTAEDTLAAIERASAEHGVSEALLRCLAWHESQYQPYAVSRTNDHGAFQFHINPNGSTLMDATPYAGSSLYDPYASANAAAWLIRRGYLGHWTTRWFCS